ncbi:MAG: hypothetical protein K6E85_02925 [Lachnospiraceae bacterium]|nr:hypothetical protein [Lachnospiraceae bacterium]
MYTKKLLTIGFNLIIFILGIIGCAMEINVGGWRIIRFYTFDSNLIGTIASGIMFLFLLAAFIHESDTIPKWIIMLKYIATCLLSVTFLVVVFVLAPMSASHYNSLGKALAALLFGNAMVYQHFLCPVISIITALFFDPPLNPSEKLINKKPTAGIAAFIAVIFTTIYAIVTIILNAIGLLDGPYPFLKVREQPIWMSCLWVIIILGLAYFIAWILAKFGTLLKPETNKDT